RGALHPRPLVAAPAGMASIAATGEALRRHDAVHAAEIAATAGRRVLVAEVTSQRDAATAALVRVLDDGAQPARVLAAQHLEAAPEARAALDQRCQGDGRADAIAAHALADAGLDERRHERGRGALRDPRRQGELLDVRVPVLGRVRLERPSEAT